MKLLFLVNGSESSAASIRAKGIAEKFSPIWQVHFAYRPQPKWKGIILFLRVALMFRPDIIYVMDTAYAGVLAGFLFKSLVGCQLITDTGDVAFELALSSGSYSKAQLQLIKWVEQVAMHYSDYLVVRGSFHKEWLSKQGITHAEFVPDGVDTTEIHVCNREVVRQSLGLNGDLVIGLVGSMSWSEKYQMTYGWDIIESLSLLKDYPVKALLIGDGDGQEKLKARASQLGVLDQVVFTGRLPYEDLPRYIMAMDVCVSTQSNNLVGMVRTTGKLPLYLACGRYVIATDVGEAQRVLPNVGCLLPYAGVRDDQHPARLAAHIKELLADPSRLQVSEKAQEVAKSEFDYKVLANRVEQICLNLVNEPRAN